jgi:hypothetical protein
VEERGAGVIRSVGFLETSAFTALFVVKYRERMVEGVLPLRAIKGGDEDATDCTILKEWKGARALLTRFKASAAVFLDGKAATLGRAFIEVLPPGAHTPWTLDESDYGREHWRVRICLIPSPGGWSYCGGAAALLAVGAVNVFDPTALASEVNFGDHARTHLVIDVRRPDNLLGNDSSGP